MISKNQVNRRDIFSVWHCFLKVLRRFYKVISKIISTVVIKKLYKYEGTSMKIRRILRIYSKSENLLMQHDNYELLI